MAFNPEGFPLDDESQKEKMETMEAREKNADKLFDDFLSLKPEEKVLFLTDANPRNTDRNLIDILKCQLTKRGIESSELLADDKTTQNDVLVAAKECDLIWDSWSMEGGDKSIDFNGFTRFIEENDKRMAWCPGVKAESLDNDGALGEDKTEMELRLNKMENRLKDVVGFRITTSYGTNLTMKLRKGERKWAKATGEIEPGEWDNLPGGEIYTTPDEENVDGVLVLPVLQDEVTLDQGVDKFVRLTIRGGKIRKIDGGVSAEKLRHYLEESSKKEKDPESVIQCAEIAFGANSKARTVANPEGSWQEEDYPLSEKEKRLGTMHIAFGSSKHGEAEGHTESNVHLDFVIPRLGLTVEKFTSEKDFEKQKNGERLIDQGGWNFV